MAENYKHLYEQMKKMVAMYQDEIVPGLRKTIEEQERKWIPVTDRLPESKEKVLVYGGRTEIWLNGTKQPMPSIHTGYLRGLGDGWFSWDHHDYICDVTHWMPLPEPPNSDTLPMVDK